MLRSTYRGSECAAVTLVTCEAEGRRARFWFSAVATIALLIAMSLPAQAQLSEKLSRSIASAQRAESMRSFRDALAIYDSVLGDASLLATGEVEPSNPRFALKRRARLFENVNEFVRAEADFTALVGPDAADAGALSDRGFFYMRRGRYYDASADFALAIRANPNDATLRYAAGRAQNALGDYVKAMTYYDETLRVDPKFSRAMLARAEAQVHLGKFEAAGRDYDRALSMGLSRRQDRFFGYLGRGYVGMRLDRYDAAVTDFDAALALDNTSVHALAWRAHTNELRGRNDLALGDYEGVAPLLPDNGKIGASLRRLRSQ